MNLQIALGFLCLYILVLNSSKVSECHVKKSEGDSYTMTFNSPQQDGDELVWKCGDKVIYKRRRGKIAPAADVDDNGSLTLTNISKSMACIYTANHSYKNGNTFSTKTFSERLCVFSRTPVPKLEVECSPSGVPILQCVPKSFPEDITLTWFHNDNEMTNEKSNRLTPQKQGRKDRYKCKLSNGIDTKDSNEEIISSGVSARAPVPKLDVSCSSSGVAILWCEPKSFPEDITLSWVHNNTVIKEKTNPLKLWKCGGNDVYKCRLSSSLNEQDSNEEIVSCEVSKSDSVPSDVKLVCIKKQVMLGLLAGVGFLLLVLTLSLVVIICKNCGHQKWKHDHEELSLYYLRNIRTDPQQLQQAARENQGHIQTPEIDSDENYYGSEICL
ncbi:uncharacterized protein LOC143142473 isoform X3 [Alosa pseudoharengus]|uniref:uncharacterized protein LOC143142473 isoform X3 n=1 Tax=Alosa pseudoharengus TaxID=34774 RepID=UPI003F89ADCE